MMCTGNRCRGQCFYFHEAAETEEALLRDRLQVVGEWISDPGSVLDQLRTAARKWMRATRLMHFLSDPADWEVEKARTVFQKASKEHSDEEIARHIAGAQSDWHDVQQRLSAGCPTWSADGF